MRNKILEKLCMKEIKSEILNEIKLLEETEEKLFGMAHRIMKATHWDYQEELIILEKKMDTEKLESENKIKEYETRMKLI